MYPLLLQQAMPFHVMFRNTCCITNQNHAIVTCCMTNQNQKQQRQYAPLRSKPPRDIVIDFGKYKGQMLGTLPPSYLQWVSENLEGWAILADHVLKDPIYQDRIEWDVAKKVMEGDCRSDEAGDLSEIAERFGWDFLDNEGWSKVNLELLGTSLGGRLPRKKDNPSEADLLGTSKRRRIPRKDNLPTSATSTSRSRRREKLKMRSRTTHEPQQQHKDEAQQQQHKDEAQQLQHKDDTVSAADIKQVVKPFPGRQAFLRKAIESRSQF